MKLNAYDRWVESLRPGKSALDAQRPVDAFVEEEMLPSGHCGRVLTVLLSNRECPYRCVFCGLWQETLDHTPEPCAVAEQVRLAIEQHGVCDAIKLYNAGSFFDEHAIPVSDHARIAALCRDFPVVIVESRPELIDARAVAFARQVRHLQIAIGLEVADDTLLALMNKRMSCASVRRASEFLRNAGMSWRAFVMVQPPFVDEADAVALAEKTVAFSAECGAQAVSLIRSYATAGSMEQFAREGFWKPPSLWTVHAAAQKALATFPGITLVDRWSLRHGPTCRQCASGMDDAFALLNTRQHLPEVTCDCRRAWSQRMADRTDSVKGVEAYRAYLHDVLKQGRDARNGRMTPPPA